MKDRGAQNIGRKSSCGFFAITFIRIAKVLLSGCGNNDRVVEKKMLMRLVMILVALLFLPEDARAQGLLGRMKQGVVDAAKGTVNEAVAATPVGIVEDKQKAEKEEALAKQQAEAEAEAKARLARQKEKEEAAEAEWQEGVARRKAEEKAAIDRQSAEREKKMAEEKAGREDNMRSGILAKLLNGDITAEGARRQMEEEELWQDGMDAKINSTVAKREERKEALEKEDAKNKEEARERILAKLLNGDITAEGARRQMEEEELWQDGMEAKINSTVAEQKKKQQDERQKKTLDALLNGQILTAKEARDRLKYDQLWQEGMEEKIKNIMAERLAKLEIVKFPLADMFKTPVNMYKDFESGMSLEWCRARLYAEIENYARYDSHENTITLKTEGGRVVFIFNKPVPEKQSVLVICGVVLPLSISHAEVLKKYKGEMPDAVIKHEATPAELPQMGEYAGNGISWDMKLSKFQQTDVLTSASKTVTIKGSILVGKITLVYHLQNRKVVICEFLKDGTVTVPDGLDDEQKQAATIAQGMLRETTKVTVEIQDNAMVTAIQNLQKAEQENEKKKQQQKKADALAF